MTQTWLQLYILCGILASILRGLRTVCSSSRKSVDSVLEDYRNEQNEKLHGRSGLRAIYIVWLTKGALDELEQLSSARLHLRTKS